MSEEQANRLNIKASASANHRAAPADHPGNRIYFDIPFEQNAAAKAAGLKWDSGERKWYAANTEIAKALPPLAEMADRQYFKVPFPQKDHAKAIGMRFDGVRKLWFAPNAALAAEAAKFYQHAEISGMTTSATIT